MLFTFWFKAMPLTTKSSLEISIICPACKEGIEKKGHTITNLYMQLNNEICVYAFPHVHCTLYTVQYVYATKNIKFETRYLLAGILRKIFNKNFYI